MMAWSFGFDHLVHRMLAPMRVLPFVRVCGSVVLFIAADSAVAPAQFNFPVPIHPIQRTISGIASTPPLAAAGI